VKRSLCAYVLLFLGLSINGFANCEDDCDACASPDRFWEMSVTADVVGNARFRTPGFENQHFLFSLAEIDLTYTRLFGCDQDGGLFIGLGYINNVIRWKQNPNFDQRSFNNIAFNIGGFSAHFPGWLWKTDIGFTFDLDACKVAKYTLYSLMIWGRYTLYPELGVHMGMIVVTGLDKNKAWPIIGIDYLWRDWIKINLVYPVDISLLLLFSEGWSAGIAQRFFWTRHRVGANEPVPESLVEYRNTGTEARITYTCAPMASISLHGGWAYGQDLIITDRLGNNGTHYKFKGAPYVGGDILIRF
jgi:hypothetical protein